MPQDTKYGQVTLENPRNIQPGEPLFILRAQDRFALKLLKVYRYFCELGGSPENHLATLDETAQRFKDWQADHPTKTPDSAGFEPKKQQKLLGHTTWCATNLSQNVNTRTGLQFRSACTCGYDFQN